MDGKAVLVTGGAGGVGRAVCRAFAGRGAHVIINYFHSPQRAENLAADLRSAGASVEMVRASVARPEAVQAMFAQVADVHGGLDVLVNTRRAALCGLTRS